MEDFKAKLADYPSVWLSTKNFLTQPQPNHSHYLKATPLPGKLTKGRRDFDWVEKLEDKALGSYGFCETNYNLRNKEEKEYFENIHQILAQPLVKVWVTDWQPSKYSDYAPTKGTHTPGTFFCIFAEGQDLK